MLGFSDKELAEDGPLKLSKMEIEQTFTPFFNIIYIKIQLSIRGSILAAEKLIFYTLSKVN